MNDGDAGRDASDDRSALEAPRPIAPLATSYVTSTQPTLRWALPPGETGALIELCRDRAFRRDCQQVPATGSSGRPSSVLQTGVWFWRLRGQNGSAVGAATSPAWYFVVRARNTLNDTSFGSQPDFNGDGIADLGVHTSGAFGNRVHVYEGRTGGPSGMPSVTAVDVSATGSGRRMANVGDVNGDGFGDLAFGAPTGSATSHVRVYLGSVSGLVVASPVMLVPPDKGSAPGFGSVVTGVGDVNGDGYADLLVGVPGASSNGRVLVYAGRADGLGPTPVATLTASALDAVSVGEDAVAAGDLNGDRYADVALPTQETSSDTGSVEVFFGSATGLRSSSDLRLVGPDGPGGYFGSSVAGTSDLNGDGYADLVVAAPRAQMGQGRLHFYPGSASGLRAMPAGSVDTAGLEPVPDLVTVAAASDANSDGFDDVLVGTPRDGSAERHAHLFLGGSAGLGSLPIASLQAAYSSDLLLGEPVAGVGDVNGDGYGDVVVALPGVMDRVGIVDIYFGTAAGVATMPSVAIMGPDGTGAQFGAALTTR